MTRVSGKALQVGRMRDVQAELYYDREMDPLVSS